MESTGVGTRPAKSTGVILIFFFVSDLIIHKIIENHFCSDHIYKKNVLNASLLEKGFKGNQSPWKFAIRNTFSSVLLI